MFKLFGHAKNTNVTELMVPIVNLYDTTHTHACSKMLSIEHWEVRIFTHFESYLTYLRPSILNCTNMLIQVS